MKKLRTTGWFLLLVILLMALVSMALAQEEPAATAGQLLQHEPEAEVALGMSSEEAVSSLTAAEPHSLPLPAATMHLAPVGEAPAQESRFGRDCRPRS